MSQSTSVQSCFYCIVWLVHLPQTLTHSNPVFTTVLYFLIHPRWGLTSHIVRRRVNFPDTIFLYRIEEVDHWKQSQSTQVWESISPARQSHQSQITGYAAVLTVQVSSQMSCTSQLLSVVSFNSKWDFFNISVLVWYCPGRGGKGCVGK